jgi:hypothetical protein
VLIAHGKLKTGPHRCDKCNTPLKRGDGATLITAFPRFMTESMEAHDFANERRYFDVERSSLTLYGSPWPGCYNVAALLRKASGSLA